MEPFWVASDGVADTAKARLLGNSGLYDGVHSPDQQHFLVSWGLALKAAYMRHDILCSLATTTAAVTLFILCAEELLFVPVG